MSIHRGVVHWADLGEASGSAPAYRRPVLVIQGAAYNRSRLSTVAVVAITSNTALAELPGNVFVPAGAAGLPRDSCVNITALATVDRQCLDEELGRLPASLMEEVDRGPRAFLAL